ncbi:hypothetical protein CDAR_516591 [Caerostris darwini]|uniref:Uncharacterized protein n=1 Tax=Caerostris darwini TaxID=1538125 RepID=A0AAV4QUM6_9ARAC|nr:hypothetical protein CDAR_516591 [Caerostris darwini]
MAQEENEDFSGRLLHQAALWGNAELLEDLLHGEMLAFLNVKDSHGRTALHAAATNENETCTRILLQAGANPNISCDLTEQFKTPLHIAAENGHLDIARILLEHDADILAKDSSGLTAMDLAEKTEHPHVMELLKTTAM